MKNIYSFPLSYKGSLQLKESFNNSRGGVPCSFRTDLRVPNREMNYYSGIVLTTETIQIF